MYGIGRILICTYTKGRGVVQRDEATFILSIHIRSILQEKLHHIKVIIPS